MGDMTAMEGHASTITSLRPGILRVVATDGIKAFAVTGGFAEISASGVSVLAEQAVPLEELTAGAMDALIAEASAALAVGTDKDSAEKALSDLQAMRASAGL
jgi:F-type H+-transporting ATPase subunit epsilon